MSRPESLKMTVVEVEALAHPRGLSYLVDGRRQEPGDRARLPIGDTVWLVQSGKAKVVPGTEETVFATAILNFPPPSEWKAGKL